MAKRVVICVTWQVTVLFAANAQDQLFCIVCFLMCMYTHTHPHDIYTYVCMCVSLDCRNLCTLTVALKQSVLCPPGSLTELDVKPTLQHTHHLYARKHDDAGKKNHTHHPVSN